MIGDTVERIAARMAARISPPATGLRALREVINVRKQRPLIVHDAAYHSEQRAEKAERRDNKRREYAGFLRRLDILCRQNRLDAGLRGACAEKACDYP